MSHTETEKDGGTSRDSLVIGAAQITPVWMDREATLHKVVQYIEGGGEEGCDLIAFGEALVPGYPFWLERTGGARFDAPDQKTWFSRYLDQAVSLEAGHLDPVCRAARKAGVAVYLGIVERPVDRGGHSLYCSMVYIDKQGEIGSVHRKLMPTYEERLVWSPGDGHGLKVHALGPFTVGGLNCWENWMPLPRAALYGLGEDLHVALWPGSLRNTNDITRFIAREGRSFVLSVSGMLEVSQIPQTVPHRDALVAEDSHEYFANGGSCLAAPDGSWVIPPQCHQEGLFCAEIHHDMVRGERQNFDAAGHYSRPDVTRLVVNRQRQSTLVFEDVDREAQRATE
ncbi:Carbon-nitrogen hydrolase family protein [Sulfidibacter corallicola]|uniref:Carbon-nitrogen hydrolase family protein n=1 Tax=Sulfidibacter corallicola TaxID=2818388 RepID=A0A8A4TM88_SULCO|nr:carbon-nitrogen hydrolase family protein [Sulfidibacter corallicola]QTD49991.1 carbon-nitrogen hydrolase family protein [Sulfidibacter corallicola]